MKKVILLVGLPDSGKMTVAGYLETFGWDTVRFSEPAERAMQALGGPSDHAGELIAHCYEMGEFYDKAFVREVKGSISDKVVIPDIEDQGTHEMVTGICMLEGFYIVTIGVRREWAEFKNRKDAEAVEFAKKVKRMPANNLIQNNEDFKELLEDFQRVQEVLEL